MKRLLAITHPDEWNQLLPFNSYVNTIKAEYDYVIMVAPYKGYIVMTEADEIVTIEDGDLFSYPSILEYLKPRRSDDFLRRCVDYCVEKYGYDNLDIKSWQSSSYDKGMVDEVKKPIVDYYLTSFDYAKKFFDNKLSIKPTKKTFENVKSTYGNMFDDNTFILLTRNFSRKTDVHNTEKVLPQLETTVKYLTDNGIKIINIGFPPKSYRIDKNYVEINDSLTQDELLSLFYLSRGVVMGADAGGFVTHYGSNVDFYLLTDEWSVTNTAISISLVDSKKTNQTISLVGLTDNEILFNLTKYGKKQIIEFSEPKLINIV